MCTNSAVIVLNHKLHVHNELGITYGRGVSGCWGKKGKCLNQTMSEQTVQSVLSTVSYLKTSVTGSMHYYHIPNNSTGRNNSTIIN